MIEFICYFLPGLFATALAGAFVKRRYSWQSFITTYGTYTLFINLGAFFYFMWAYGYMDEVFTEYAFSVSFCIEYLIIAVAEAIVFAIVFELIRKNFRISLEVRKDKKTEVDTIASQAAKGEIE